ncbi:hypothetical protein AK88_01106 [Plasmodium fragile]|uniref:DNA mismatch repair protein PMS1 n=1 Tax=Plasmodium fragile TaxID=5857 RepID=A0A0D9QQM9_PLAFR|nr:uncharacterized protein AK88_01106 [Plasmodium fragile]KJP89228.1 hypothetical protein AK88_01106 [Plasmodium fragile]
MKIQNIGEESIHNICSSQVIFTLSSVVKELVENSIDANATEIKIKLVENGIKLIQVNDNGAGIKKSNFENVCARHATSKITEFEDIHSSLNTLGFRGEALNSLCMLSDLHIITKHDEGSHGYLLKFDNLGRLSHEEPTARLRGTTVSCENIFKNIPIRKKDFIKNIKSQLSDLLLLMQQYAIIYSHVKFSIQNVVTVKGNVKNMNMLLTNGGKETIKNSVHTIYGKRNIGNLIDFNIDSEEWKLRAYISDSNSGRRDRDIQFYYINSRPIHVIKNVNKIINSIYKEFNSRLYPIIICNILSDAKNFDINVTPDKREVFFIYENELCERIKTSLVRLLTPKTSQLVDTHIGDYFLKANNIQLPMLGGSLHETGMLERPEKSATIVEGVYSAGDPIQIGEDGKKAATPPSMEGSSIGGSFSERTRDSSGGVKEELPMAQQGLPSGRDGGGQVGQGDHNHANVWPEQAYDDDEAVGIGSFTKSSEPQVCVRVKEEHPEEERTPPVDSSEQFFTTPGANGESRSSEQVDLPSSYHRAGRIRQGWQVEGFVSKKDNQGDSQVEEAPRVQAYEYQLGDGSTDDGCDLEDHHSVHAFEYKLDDSPKLCVQEYQLEDSPKLCVQEYQLEDSPKLCVQEYQLEDSPKLCVQEYQLEDSPKLFVQEYQLKHSPKLCVQEYQLQDPPKAESHESKVQEKGNSPHYDVINRGNDERGEGELKAQSQHEGGSHKPIGDSPDPPEYTFEELKENIKSSCIKSIPIDINMYINREQMKSGFDYDQIHVVNLTNNEKIKNIIFPQGKEQEKANNYLCLTDKKNINEYADLFNGSLNIKEAAEMESQGRSASAEDISFSNIDERQKDLYFKSNLFEKLRICGQFNKGFVISKIDLLYFQQARGGNVVGPVGSGGGDEAEPQGNNSSYALFIIDQHAADEKSNFEKYNKIFTMKSQRLISKIGLELSPAQIYIIEKNLEIFLHNGFDLEIVEEPAQKRRRLEEGHSTGAAGAADSINATDAMDQNDAEEGALMEVKVYLLSLPVFNGKILEVEDFMSLLHHLTEHPITYDKANFQMFVRNKNQPNKQTDTWFNYNFPRPQKVWRILASKACRNAIMVGKTLNVAEMIKIKKKLSVLKNPWNCPHGRPTIKYIINDMDIKSCFENYYVKLYDEITNLVVTKNYDAYKYLFHNHAFFLIMSTKPLLGPLLKFQ